MTETKTKIIACIFFFGFMLSSPIVLAQTDCKVVWPQFGVVSCEVPYGSTIQTEQKPPTCVGNDCTFTFSCAGKSGCYILSTDISLSCNTWGYCSVYTINNGQTLGPYSTCTGGTSPPQSISISSTATVTGNCQLNIIGYPKEPLSNDSRISMSYQNTYLYDTNPDYPKHKVDESVGCVPNGIMYESGYTSQLPSSWIDSNGNIGGSKPSNLVDTLPTNMAVGDTYSYFYKYIEVSGINVVTGKDGNLAGYCGGSLGNRQLLSYSQITSGGGCYIIPTSFQREVECCFNDDCKWKDPSGKLLCDPTTFTCTDKVPCNSDIDCQVPWQSYSCVNNVETNWICDLSQEWYPKQGTCKMVTETVLCCSDNDCPRSQYCDKDAGCQDRYTLVDCPSGKCCESGGNYKSQTCAAGQTCCYYGDPIIGECKLSCETTTTISGQEADISDNQNVNTSTDLVPILAIIVPSVAIASFIVYRKKIKIGALKKIVEVESKDKPTKRGRFCTKCGARQKSNVKFCTNCGHKIK